MFSQNPTLLSQVQSQLGSPRIIGRYLNDGGTLLTSTETSKLIGDGIALVLYYSPANTALTGTGTADTESTQAVAEAKNVARCRTQESQFTETWSRRRWATPSIRHTLRVGTRTCRQLVTPRGSTRIRIPDPLRINSVQQARMQLPILFFRHRNSNNLRMDTQRPQRQQRTTHITSHASRCLR